MNYQTDYHLKVEDYSLKNSQIGLHEYLLNRIFEGEASQLLLPCQAPFVMCLVERGFISKVNSLRLILASTNFELKQW